MYFCGCFVVCFVYMMSSINIYVDVNSMFGLFLSQYYQHFNLKIKKVTD